LGLISLIDHSSLHQAGPDITWRQFMCDLLNLNRDAYIDNIKQAMFDKLGQDMLQVNATEE
jgi:hypothetical protein